jgi:hypothetical protein
MNDVDWESLGMIFTVVAGLLVILGWAVFGPL